MKLRVAVLRGGPSSEYEVSLKSGAAVLKALADTHHAHDVLIGKDGTWHFQGMPQDPHDILKHMDVVFNALHGEYGEDGKVQRLLDTHGAAYTGSGSLASAIGMNKSLAKEIFKKHGIKVAQHIEVEREDDTHALALRIFKSFPLPAVVKPSSAGSSVGVSVVKAFHDLGPALLKAFQVGEKVLVEEFIAGKEATCGVLEHFRGQRHYALLPVEIKHDKGFFDYDAKYGGGTEEICPGNFSAEESAELQKIAIEAHKVLGLRHYSRTDFIVSPKRGIYVLEINTLPGLTEQSLLPKAFHAIGGKFSDLVGHLVDLAHSKK